MVESGTQATPVAPAAARVAAEGEPERNQHADGKLVEPELVEEELLVEEVSIDGMCGVY